MLRYYKQASLRSRMLVSIALPLFLLLSGMAFFRYYEEKQIIRDGVENSAQQIGEVMTSALQYAMLQHDTGLISNIIHGSAQTGDIARVQLIDENSKVVVDSQGPGGKTSQDAPGCIECHQYPEGSLPKTVPIPGEQMFRVATTIRNSPECNTCHDAQKENIGVLLVDISAREQLNAANDRLLVWLVVSLLFAVGVFIFAYWRMQRVFASRIESLSAPLAAYGDGNLSVRLPVSKHDDEIDQIAIMFNQMADDLEQHVAEKATRDQLLQRTIIEERERIARELHDSLPQLLAYLNAKLGAISLYVENGKKNNALENLAQLETAIKQLFSDIREAIIGLRMSRQITKGLVFGIKAYIEQFTQLCGQKVDFSYDPILEDKPIDPQTEVHLLRIVQEGLSNVRKYARATRVSVSLLRVEETIELTIQDNGVGFDPVVVGAGDTSHFGLQTMRERAEACGGVFVLESGLDMGTKIMAKIPAGARNQ